ncbi:DNA polymerase III subunit delta [soil metagenome]
MAGMVLRPASLPAHLASAARSGRLHSLYVVASAEPLLQIETCDALRAATRELGHAKREVATVQGRFFDWSGLAGNLGSQSLFAERRIVELRLPTGKPGREGAVALPLIAQQMASAEASGDDTIVLIVSLPRLDREMRDARWFEALCGAGVLIQIDAVERAALPRWLSERLAQQGQSAPAAALDFIAERVEGNLLAAHQEIAKLGLLHGPRAITLEEVQDAVLDVARYDVFKLGEALLAGDAARFAQMLDGLEAEGEPMPLLLWAITEELRWLARLRRMVDSGRSVGQAIKDSRAWGARERLLPQALERLDSARIEHAIRRCAVIDKTSKGLSFAALGESMTGRPFTDLLATALALMPPAAVAPARSARR